MNGKGNSRISRRSLLRTGATTLTIGLAGCSLDQQLNKLDDDGDTGETHRYQRQDVIRFRSVTASERGDDDFTFNYDALPERGSTFDVNNRRHPDTRNIEFDIEDGSVTTTLKRVLTETEIDIELWMGRNGGWERVSETTTPYTDGWTDEFTLEFTDIPSLTTHTANAFALVAVEDPAEWDDYPGRILKVARYIAVPYDGPDGRTTRVFDGREVTYESYQNEVEPLTIDNNVVIEDLDNNEKAVFFLIEPQSTGLRRNSEGQDDVIQGHAGYGVATTIPQDIYEEQNYEPVAITNVIYQMTDIEEYAHFNILGNEIKTANEKLGRWGSLTEKFESLVEFTSGLTYEQRGLNVRHPTGALFQDDSGRNCTEKTYIFSALLQCEPFNYSGDDGAYVGCSFLGTGHYIIGVNVDKFEEIPSNWERHNYSEDVIQQEGAPTDEQYIMMDVTNGRVGQLAPDQYSSISVIENLDAEYIFE